MVSAGCLIAAERLRDQNEDLARKAAMVSLAAVFCAGVLFVVDVPQIGGLMKSAHVKKDKKKKGEPGEEEEDGEGEDKQAAEAAAAAEAKAKQDPSKPPPDCSDCPEFVDIPPGPAQIGASADEPEATRAEKPGKSVMMWPGFSMAQRPVTIAQYRRFADETGRKMPKCARSDTSAPAGGSDPGNAPVTCVTFDDATAYAAWLSQKTNRPYRLPTAEQWEYVARNTRDADSDSSSPIKQPRRNWPIEGMRVGIAEIVSDCWSEKLGEAAKGTCRQHVLKGSSRGEAPRWQQPWARRPVLDQARSSDVGFRVVRATAVPGAPR